MRYIRRRNRSDNLVNDIRKPNRSYGRLVYLVTLVFLSVQVLNYFYGDIFFLRADGVVVREKISIESLFIARVEDIKVRSGDSVKAGDAIIKLNSVELRQQILEFSLESLREQNAVASLTARKTELLNESSFFVTGVTESTKAEILAITLLESGYIRDREFQAAVQVKMDAKLALQRHETALANVSMLLDQSVKRSKLLVEALERLQDDYNNGAVLSPIDGDIGLDVVSIGDVVLPADPLVEIYHGEPFVYAYLPDQYMRNLFIGINVEVHAFNNIYDGEIVNILPLSSGTPEDFHNSIRPSERYQIIRISVNDPHGLPLNHRVTVYRKDYLITSLLAHWFG